jgi:hypothetical protein
MLYWKGQPDLAIPFYEIAARLRTGSEGSITSAIRLRILDGDFEAAAAGSLFRARRYPSAYPYRDYLSFLHAMGRGEEAWRGFLQAATAFDLPQIWVSALVGHRRDGRSEQEVRSWLQQPEIRDATFRARRFALGYAILVNATDRLPPADLGELVVALEGEAEAHIDVDGVSLLRPHPIDPSASELV